MIRSESQFIWSFLLKIILLPINFLLVLIGKKPVSELKKPFSMFWEFIYEAKITFSLIIINIFTYISSLFLNEEIFLTLANVPSDILTFNWFSLITSGFLHGDIVHLLGNMLILFLFGRIVEKELGSKKMLIIYFGSLIISNIISSLINLFVFQNNIPGIGASGAIMGLIATSILLDPIYISHVFIIPLPSMIIGWIYIYTDITGVISGVQDGIGHFAHLGGFISISFLMFFLEKDEKNKMIKGLIINIVSIIVATIVYFIV